MYRRWLMGIIALLIASGLLPGALAASSEAVRLESGDLTSVLLTDAPQSFVFSPSANGLYDVYLFPDSDDAHARAEVWLGDELLAEGEGVMRLLDCRLTAENEYTLILSGAGSGRMEIARETLSRCFDMPLELADGEGYDKLIAREGDVHWYAITAETTGAALLACAPGEHGLRPIMQLFDENGGLISDSESLATGSSVISAEFEAGQRCYVRVTGYQRAAGKYSLTVLRSENPQRPQSVSIDPGSLDLKGRSVDRLSVATYPVEACELVFLDSTDRNVASVSSGGWVEGRQEGLALITAYAYGGARSSCRVTVQRVGVERVSFASDEVSIPEGERRPVQAILSPPNATNRTLSYATGDESVAVVSGGEIVAVGEGRTTVTVISGDGGLTDTMTVTVTPARKKYRALLIGEQTYASTVEEEREGSVKSVESLTSLIQSMSFDGDGYSAHMIMDASRDNVLAGIRRAFADAREADVSLVYITCHGFYRAGMTFFVMADGSVLSASDLERELRKIPGEIILIVDCCGSGGVLGETAGTEALLDGVVSVFQGASGSAGVRSSKYKVIASARPDQESYRISFDQVGMATVFARALCDAAGWSIDRNAPAAMNADTNYDSEITLDELDSYLSKRVMWYLGLAGEYVQNVCVYPQGDNSVIFARGEE